MDQSTPFIERLLDLEIPAGVRISPSAKLVVYETSPRARKGQDTKSSIWIADVGKEHSARRLTSGLFNDRSPSWTPDGKSVIFISDRAKPGKSCALYCLNVLESPSGEAYPLTPIENEKSIEQYKIQSKLGNFIAYISPDEDSPEKKQKQESQDDGYAEGDDWEWNRLRFVHVSTKVVQKLDVGQRHASYLTWKDDGSELVLLSQATPEPDETRMRFHVVNTSTLQVVEADDFNGPIMKDIVYDNASSSRIIFLAGAHPMAASSSLQPYLLEIGSDAKPRGSRVSRGNQQRLICYESYQRNGPLLITKTRQGVKTVVDINTGSKNGDDFSPQLRPDDPNVKCNFGDLDFAIAGDESKLGTVGAFVRLSSSSGSEEVVSVALRRADGKNNDDVSDYEWDAVVLSSHSATITEKPFSAPARLLVCPGTHKDEPIESLLFMPSGVKGQPKNLPCVVIIHGGPYSSSIDCFDGNLYYWNPLLAEHGYAILSPNYSGGSGRGEHWAAKARGGVGTVDYDDVIAAVWDAIQKGYIDRDRIVVGGWSQGGFLSYLCATRNGLPMSPTFKDGDKTRTIPPFSFKGAICGAGVCDWDMMSMTSDMPTFEAELAGGAPWEEPKSSVAGRKGSAIWEISQAKREGVPPLLMLHGKEDKRVPWTQALAYSRACKAKGIAHEFVTYPREPHLFAERAHLLDMALRVLRFVQAQIG